MKKAAVSLFFLFVTFTMSAQTTKGSVLIGGNGSLKFNKNDYDCPGFYTKSTAYSIAPVAGYFVIPNLCVGLSLPVSWSSSKTTATGNPTISGESTSFSYGVGPFVRYYIPVRSFFIVTEGSYALYNDKSKYPIKDPNTGVTLSDNKNTNHNPGYKLAAGPAFFLSNYTSIEILANYSRTNYGDGPKQSNFFISVGFQIYLPSGSTKE
jgi:hypothetical protein